MGDTVTEPTPTYSQTAMTPSEPPSEPVEIDLYARLATPFEHVFSDTRGGATFDYVTGEQVTSRLNEELGFLAWSFRIAEHGFHHEADEAWVLGELTVTLDGRSVARQQFGSQKVKRSRSTGLPMDIGFDLKGAATDCLKKCASLVGVGLYLSEKGGQPSKRLKTKAELRADVARGLEAGRALGLTLQDVDTAGMSHRDLRKAVLSLSTAVREAQAAAARTGAR